ncbi:MAG: Hsp20/alpha crystallin family protein [Dethiobacteria bacterium]|jgi:HSP20 family protein
MSLIEWNPFREMEKEMSNYLERSPFRFFGGFGTPRVDIYQTEKDITVKAEIPGVSKEDLNIFIDENSIRLSGKTKKDEVFKDENVYKRERYFGSFSRTIPLPAEVNSEQATAEYHDGILSITAPKIEPSRTRGRRIDIH